MRGVPLSEADVLTLVRLAFLQPANPKCEEGIKSKEVRSSPLAPKLFRTRLLYASEMLDSIQCHWAAYRG